MGNPLAAPDPAPAPRPEPPPFDAIVRHCSPIVRRILRGHGARGDEIADLEQEVFLTTLRTLPRCTTPEAPWAWVYGIAWNVGRRRRCRRSHERSRPNLAG